jgi:hypothetical protein
MESEKRDASVRADPDVFWDQYEIPFEFETAYKYRRHEINNGLTGPRTHVNRAVHLFPIERVVVPGSVVEAGSYYCEDGASHHHAEYGPDGGLISQLDGETYPRVVTCKRCLKGMQRWKIDE